MASCSKMCAWRSMVLVPWSFSIAWAAMFHPMTRYSGLCVSRPSAICQRGLPERSGGLMSSQSVSDYSVAFSRAKSFYTCYERKDELQQHTHYCPGCGHGVIHKMLAQAIDALGIQDRTILVGPVGCGVFTDYYFNVANVQAAHARAPAVATAIKRSRPDAIVIGYQGDGDLSAIGTAEIVHAANRGENISVIFVNNAVY